MLLHLPRAMRDNLWTHALREAPHECVGALGGTWQGQEGHVVTFYPFQNVSPTPETQYLAHPGHFLRALKAMQAEGLELAALYHSHPHGPGQPSLTDTRLAEYPVPYIIADLKSRLLHAYLLPTGERVRLIEAE
ncbi:Mov34/MPN/PAD-1 family protein [Deinococcus fonticola]|uniref:Mov34/MPN/PAD-1 family protein n=1 Tax=Deinococcus fonticola TaxID=2528713 RepID=UPI001F118C1A|nr:M67 family metallopeptidase [Deinococcus fonticola]